MTHVPVCRITIIEVEQRAQLYLSRFRDSQKKLFLKFGLGYFIYLCIYLSIKALQNKGMRGSHYWLGLWWQLEELQAVICWELLNDCTYVAGNRNKAGRRIKRSGFQTGRKVKQEVHQLNTADGIQQNGYSKQCCTIRHWTYIITFVHNKSVQNSL